LTASPYLVRVCTAKVVEEPAKDKARLSTAKIELEHRSL